MTNRLLGKVLACILAIMMPAATMAAETHAAMLYASNAVLLNGVWAEHSSAIFSGDSIQTPDNSVVRLTSQGSTVVVGPSSSLVYQGDAVQLRSGSTLVTTDKGIKTQVQRLLISPAAQGRSSYRVARGGGQIQIAALRGSLKISDGSTESSVAEGNTTAIPDPEPQATPPTGTSGGKAGGLSGKTIAIVGAGVAAGVVAVVLATTGDNNKTPLTPQ